MDNGAAQNTDETEAADAAESSDTSKESPDDIFHFIACVGFF